MPIQSMPSSFYLGGGPGWGPLLVEPAVSRVVNEHDTGCMIIYWIWLKFYLNTAYLF